MDNQLHHNNNQHNTKTGLIFDLDGTLINSKELIVQAFTQTLSKFHIQFNEEEMLTTTTGMPLADCYKLLVPDAHHPYEEFMVEHDQFQVNNMHLAVPFDDTVPTLKKARSSGIKCAILTNRTRRTTYKVLELYNLTQYFEIILAVEDVIIPKPHREGVDRAREVLQTHPDKTYMIGDSTHDVKAGKNAGVKTIGVTTGFHPESMKSEQPDYLITTLGEVFTCIQG